MRKLSTVLKDCEPTGNHRYAECTALRWSDWPGTERNPVDLVFEYRHLRKVKLENCSYFRL
jgi:hypothetical protein